MPAMGIGALTPWLEREFLSQRNQHGDAFPNLPLVDPKRVQLITATGTTTENGEELVWTEVADGEFWIHCCFPRDLVTQFDSSNARAKPFSSYSATKGLFRLVRYRFVLARPLIPPHASPRKQQLPNKEPRLRSLRICLRVDEFKLYSQGQGSLLGRYEDFRKWFPVAPAPPGGEGTSEEPVAGAAAKARVEWVKRIECGEESSSSSKKKQQQKDETDSGAAAPKIEFLQDLQGASDPKPRFPKPSPPPPAAAAASIADPPLAAPLFSPIASTSHTNPPPPSSSLAPASLLLPRHRPIPSVRDGVPPYIPTATWPADAQVIVKIDWREGEERIQKRAMAPPPPPSLVVVETKTKEEEKKVVVPPERGREMQGAERPDKEEEAEVEMLLLGGAGSKPNSPTKETTTATETATETAETTKPIKVDWSPAAEKLQRRHHQQQQQQQSETRAGAVQARPSKPPTTTIHAPSAAAASSPSRRPAHRRQNPATSSSPAVEPRADPTTRVQARSRPSAQQPPERARVDAGPGPGPGTAEESAAKMRERYEAAWRVKGKDGPEDGKGKVSSPPSVAAEVVGVKSAGKEDALGLAAPPRVSSNAAPAPDSALSIGPAQPPLPELAKPNQLNDSGGPTDPAPQHHQGQLLPSIEPAVGGVTAGVALSASVSNVLADIFEQRANDEAKSRVVKTGAGSSTTSGSRAGPSTTQGVARPSFHGDTNTRAAAEKRAAALAARNTRAASENRITALFAARRAADFDAKRRRDELEQDQDALNRPRQPKLDERHVSPSHRLDGEGQGLGLFRSASPASPAGDSTSRFDSTNSHRNDATREESILSQDLEQASPDPSDSDEGSKTRPGPASEAHPTHHSRQAQETSEDPNWALLRHMQDLSAAQREVKALQMRPEAAIRWVAAHLREGESIFGGVGDYENEDEDDQKLAGLADEANEEDVEAEQDEEAARERESEAEKAALVRAQRVVDGKERNKRGRHELADDDFDDDYARADPREKRARAVVATVADLKADESPRGFGDTLEKACVSEIDETTQETSADEDAEMQDARSDVSGSERVAINPHDAPTLFTVASQDDKMHVVTRGATTSEAMATTAEAMATTAEAMATTAEAMSSSVSPDRLLPERTDRAEPAAVVFSAPTTAAAAAVQDLGEVLIDSAQLAGSPSTAAKSHHSPSKRPQKVTWRIKPELFDFGLWCRANEITA